MARRFGVPLVLLLGASTVVAFQRPPGAMEEVAEPFMDARSTRLEVPGDTTAAGSRLWERPDGPVRIALQAGHWRAAEAPDEQAGLRTNGTRGGGKQEWEVNLDIARRTAAILTESGYEVEILPTTIPPGYWADVFISIHADGHSNSTVSGFRAAAPRRDATGRAADLVEVLERAYAEATGLPRYPTVTRRMLGYYAFNWRRYEHSLHPMTTGVILETGFLTSPHDRRIIVSAPDRAAQGIAEAVRHFVDTVDLEAPLEVPLTAVRFMRPPATD